MERLKEEMLGTLISRRVGRHIHCYQDLDSTNRVTQELARQGAAEETIVLAERQLSGRGR